MNNLLLLGHGEPIKLVIDSLNRKEINIINVEQDRLRTGEEQVDFHNYLNSNKILLNKLDSIKISDFNLILSVNYNKIIDIEKFLGVKMINLHMGILPRFRGNNANAWAVLNGENKVGYTIHELTNVLDAGNIFYKFEYDISNDETYFEGKNAINKNISDNINNVLISIFNSDIKPVTQDGASFMYCVKLKPSDGIISDWNVKSDILKRKSYVFGKPLGTGLKFYHNYRLFEVDKVNLIKDYEKSYGVPGSIVFIRDNCIWVKTKDTAIELQGISIDDSFIEVKKIFKIGMRLY